MSILLKPPPQSDLRGPIQPRLDVGRSFQGTPRQSPGPLNPPANDTRSTTPSRSRWWLRLLVLWLVGKLVLLVLVPIVAWVQLDLKEHAPWPGEILDFARRPVVFLDADQGYEDFVYPLWRGLDEPSAPIPSHVRNAFLVAEDHRFYEHRGVSFLAALSAVIDGIGRAKFRGASTIDMQVARLLFLSGAVSWERKTKEAVLALYLNLALSKEEILEVYLNRVPLGRQAYGIEMGARTYFGRRAHELDLLEAAALASALPSPSDFNPISNPAKSIERAHRLIRRMADRGRISIALAEEALGRTSFRPRGDSPPVGSSRFYVRDLAMNELRRLGVAAPESQAVRLVLTVDPLQQQHVERALAMARREQETYGFDQAAIVLLDRQGNIRALTGGLDYAAASWSRANRVSRPVASTFKPIVYAAAIELLEMNPASLVLDAPLRTLNGRPWPANTYREYHGLIGIAKAIAISCNTCAVRIVEDIGPQKMVDFALGLGWQGRLEPVPSLALGVGDGTLLNLTEMYAMLANGGRKASARLIQEVRATDGRILHWIKPEPQEQVISSKAACTVGKMLEGAVTAPGATGRQAAFQHPVAGKTGTSQGNRDGWFLGYTGHFVGGIWLGNEQGGASKLTGGDLAARVFRNLMANAHQGLPVRDLECGAW